MGNCGPIGEGRGENELVNFLGKNWKNQPAKKQIRFFLSSSSFVPPHSFPTNHDSALAIPSVEIGAWIHPRRMANMQEWACVLTFAANHAQEEIADRQLMWEKQRGMWTAGAFLLIIRTLVVAVVIIIISVAA